MRLNRGSKLLDDLWDSSKSMTDEDLFYFDGIYWVEMATGVIPNLPHWRKYISNIEDMLAVNDNLVSGYNVIFRDSVGFPGKTFGKFGVRLYHYGKDRDEKLYLGLLLEYDNGRFKDYIRLISPDLFLGRFYIVIPGREVFMGYFWLYKTKEYRRSSLVVFRGTTNSDTLVIEDEAVGTPLIDLGQKVAMERNALRNEIYNDTIAKDLAILEEEARDINIVDDKEEKTDPDEIEVDLWEESTDAEGGVRKSQEDDLDDGWVAE